MADKEEKLQRIFTCYCDSYPQLKSIKIDNEEGLKRFAQKAMKLRVPKGVSKLDVFTLAKIAHK